MCRILSAGLDRHLMEVRSMLLRQCGHTVVEAYSLQEALRLLRSGPIDVLLVCHTLTPAEHANLIGEANSTAVRLPVICLIAREGGGYPDCLCVENSPAALLNAIEGFSRRNGTRPYRNRAPRGA